MSDLPQPGTQTCESPQSDIYLTSGAMSTANTIAEQMTDHSLLKLPRHTWLWAIPFLTLGFCILGQILAIAPVVELGLIPKENLEIYPHLLYMLFGPFSMIGLILIAWIKWFERRNLDEVGMAFNSQTLRQFLSGYGVSITIVILSVCTTTLLGGYQPGEQLAFTLVNITPAILMFAGFTLQSSVEEFLFRGWILQRFSEKKGKYVGITASALGFTLLHLLSFDYETNSITSLILFSLMTTLFSVYLCLMTLKHKSIWFACSWHAGWNWFFINGFGLPTTGISVEGRPLLVNLDNAPGAPAWLNGGLEGPENTVVTVVLLTLICVLTWRATGKTTLEKENGS